MSTAPTAPPAPASWSPPAEFDEYRLVRPLGRGRMGQVFLAHDTLLERAVAVKFVLAPDGAALARFLNEARAAARVQHPNVATLYRVGQLDAHAYLVSEYLRGVTLDRLRKPMPSAKALELGRELAQGLAAAHRRGVLHRDVKPANALLTETGQVKLLDFGLAKLLGGAGAQPPGPEALLAAAQSPLLSTPAVESLAGERLAPGTSLVEGAGQLVGTPYYMSPEAWRGEEPTPRSDLYSLGAVLYELCCGRAPFRHVPLGELAQALQAQRPVPLGEAAPGLDAGLAALIDRLLEPEPAARFGSADEVLDALGALGPETPGLKVPEGNPYRGLQPFEAEHRALFFGRSRDLQRVLERLRAEPFVLLTGDSGVGKSSLAVAGVLPALQEGALRDGRAWEVRRLVPGRRPLTALALALAPLLGEAAERLAAQLQEEPGQLARRLRAALGAARGLALYLDQLEELLTVAEPEEARRLALALAPLAAGVAGVRLLGSARADFLTRLAGLPGLGPHVSQALALVPPLGAREVREAVVGPARVKGGRFESEALVQTLVEAGVSSGGGLPLLQFALAQLWEAREREQGLIRLSALQLLGGVSGALARHADGVVDALAGDIRRAVRGVLLRLVTADGTRARRSAQELAGGDARYEAALEALVRGRLLVARDSEDGGTFEVAHEALLGGWGTLARWIAEDAETRALRERLEAAAREWERTGRHAEALWGERAVQEAQALDLEALPEREARFVRDSRAGLRRRERRRRLLAVALLAALLAVAGVARLRAVLEREGAADAELASARLLLAEARSAGAREEAARGEAFRLFDAGRKEAGEEAWSRARGESAGVDRAYARAGEALERAHALSPERADLRAELAQALLERAERAERDGQAALRDLLAQRLQLVEGEGGPSWARWSAPARLEVALGAGAQLSVERYEPQPDGALARVPVPTPPGARQLQLPPGSYLLAAREGARSWSAPVLLRRGAQARVALAPPPSRLPPGFLYVPEGSTLFGSAAEEGVRTFFSTAPLHAVHVPAFLIAQHETTWAQWLEYLEALDPGERAARTPRTVGTGFHGGLELARGPEGRWTLSVRPSTERLQAREGEPLRYPGRRHRASVDWRRLPVVGISDADARAYAAWLARTGRVPGARLCSELEWERAARGADGREFPHGDRLLAHEANFDLTYGREPLAFGADEVGSHPASRSPFGVDDLAGNVWEWTDSVLTPGRPLARGGSYYFAANTCRAINRESPEPGFRDLTVGMRLCASVPGPVGR